MQQESRLPRSTGSLIRLCISEAVSLLELNDPSRFNALSMEMASDMQAAVMWLASQEEGAFKSLVIQGAGDHFCPGGNMHRMKRADARSAPSLAAVARGSIDLFDGFCQLRALPVPVTCAVHGAVLGGGLAVCLLTDHVTCDNAATFQARAVCSKSRLAPRSHSLSHTSLTTGTSPCRWVNSHVECTPLGCSPKRLQTPLARMWPQICI